jgi:hypothetical protein
MPTPVPVYPAEGDVYRNVEDHADQEKRNVERIKRSLLGISPRDPLPETPRNVPFPKMIYRPEYFASNKPEEQRPHSRTVLDQQQLSDAQKEGFLPTLAEASEQWKQKQEQAATAPDKDKKK